jgi:hypothetical protein
LRNSRYACASWDLLGCKPITDVPAYPKTGFFEDSPVLQYDELQAGAARCLGQLQGLDRYAHFVWFADTARAAIMCCRQRTGGVPGGASSLADKKKQVYVSIPLIKESISILSVDFQNLQTDLSGQCINPAPNSESREARRIYRYLTVGLWSLQKLLHLC